jgi:drug/metabolite transporter (DMT)-like permease
MQPGVTWSAGAWVAIGAALASALAHILVRRLNATDYPLVIVLNFTLLTCIVSGMAGIPFFVMPDLTQVVLLIFVALFASLGQLFMTQAYQQDQAPAIASASYTSVILAVVYGYFIWGEVPHPFTWLGGGLIVAGGILLVKARFRITEPPSPAVS